MADETAQQKTETPVDTKVYIFKVNINYNVVTLSWIFR